MLYAKSEWVILKNMRFFKPSDDKMGVWRVSSMNNKYEESQSRLLREEYISRINKVQDYIEANLDKELSLEQLSREANFSKFHFHRIFGAITGESLWKYIQRIRLERAALILLSCSRDSVAQISSKCGFSNQASFSKAFKKHFGFSATELRKNPDLIKSKNGKTESKDGKDDLKSFLYNDAVRDISLDVEVKYMREIPVIYVRNTGMFKGEKDLFLKLFRKLYRWADARGLVNEIDTKVISLYHDYIDITNEERFRTSICLSVPDGTEVSGEIGKMTIQEGKYAIGHFTLFPNEYEGAWNALIKWLPESGYEPDDRPCFEVYLNDPSQEPDGKSIVDMYVPVKPL